MVAVVASSVATSTNNTDATSVTVTKPAGTAEGHLMIAVTHGYVADTFTPPTGWTFLELEDDGASLRSRAYYKVAGASEPANYTFTFQPGPGGGTIGASIITFSGHGGIDSYFVLSNGTTDPIDWLTGWPNAPTRDGISYEVVTWRDTTSNTTTWTGATELFDATAGDAGLTQYRGQSGATEFSFEGTPPTFSANITNSITHSVVWQFFIADAVPANESWASTGTAVELEVNGTWVDVTDDVRYDAAVSITRGTSSQGGQVNPSTAAFTLDNISGDYSVLNPTSPHYPYLNLTVPCRISKAYGTVAMETLGFHDVVADPAKGVDRFRATSNDTLNITGDIDIRIDVEPKTWKQFQVLAAKHCAQGGGGVGSVISGWVFYIDSDGAPNLYWNDSSGVVQHNVSATACVGTELRQALRVTMDVNNGSSGHTVTFYTSDSLGGSWTQLGDAVVVSGTTDINANVKALTVGAVEPLLEGNDFTYFQDNRPLPLVNTRLDAVEVVVEPSWKPFRGRIYGMELKNGIAGTTVAKPTFDTQTTGTKSFTDAQSNLWVAYGYVVCHNRKYRHHGEITSWPQPRDITGNNAWVDIESSGVLNREQQGTPEENSALYKSYTNPAGSTDLLPDPYGNYVPRGPYYPVAYWPMEDDALPGADTDAQPQDLTWSSIVRNFRTGGHQEPKPGTITGTIEFGSDNTFFASKSAAKFTTGSMIRFPVDNAESGAWLAEFIIYAPDGITNGSRIAEVRQTGADRIIRLTYSATDTLVLTVHDASGTQIDSSGSLSAAINRKHNRLSIFADGTGGYNLLYENQSDRVATNLGSALGTTTGRIYEVRLNANQTMNGVYLAHLAVFDGEDATTYPYGSGKASALSQSSDLDAWRREPAARRAERLTWEQQLVNYNIGDGGSWMGIQTAKSYVQSMQDVQATDMGYVYEPRNVLGLGYRTRSSMLNAPAILELSYEGNDLSGTFSPVRDNRGSINDMTVVKDFGAKGRYELTEGTRSTQRPPNGIGRYRDEQTISLYRDRDLVSQAAWRVFMSTRDDLRVDTITIALENPRIGEVADNVYRFYTADIGDHIALADLPLLLQPDDMDLNIIGYTETFDQFQHTITFNCVPGSAFAVGQTVETTSTTSSKANSTTTTTSEALDTTETAIDVTVESGSALWSQTASDFDIVIGGERMTVTSLSYVSDAFGRTVVDGWGSADTGQSWTNTGGAASEYDVGSGVGTHNHTSVSVVRQSTVATPYNNADFDVTATVSTDKLAVGGSQFVYAVGRWADTNNMYYARLEFATTAVVTLTLRKRVAGVDGVLGTFVLDETHAAGRQFSIRIQGIGTAIKARAWRTGYAEPDYWQTSATDSDLTASGQVGVRGVLSSAASNTPVLVSWDNFTTNALTNQTFNVTRSVNGVVKSHSTGADVQLFKKAYTALGNTIT